MRNLAQNRAKKNWNFEYHICTQIEISKAGQILLNAKRSTAGFCKIQLVFVELSGGLGNQIFLFETAKFLASIDNRVIFLSTFHIDRTHSKGKSSLQDFVLPLNTRVVYINKYISIFLGYLKKYSKFLNRLKQPLILILTENESKIGREFITNLIKRKNPKIIWLVDFWQNFDYWNDDTSYELQRESVMYKQLSQKMARINPIVIHYRLGWLGDHWEHSWGALSPVYIEETLKNARQNSKGDKLSIWVFSNDYAHSRKLIENHKFDSDYCFEFINDEEMLPAEVFKLFSESLIFVCSNSTFSLAAAKLGKVPKVYVPSELSWRGAINVNIPKYWKKVESRWLLEP